MEFSVRASLEQFTLAHPAGGAPITISVAAPAVAPDANVPILFVVDGDLVFGMAAEIARAMSSVGGVPAHYVVGIGYDADYAAFLKLRTADLTPPLAAQAREAMGAFGAMIGSERSGGADAVLAFLVDMVMPELAVRHPRTVGGAHILFGHSLGGLFAANALLTRPDSFSAYVISSPSLWWDGFSVLQKLPAFAGRLAALPRQPRIFVDVGGKEQDLPTHVPPELDATLEEVRAQILACRMVDAAVEFADALTAAGASVLRRIVFAEDDHMSVVPAALLHGARFALGRAG